MFVPQATCPISGHLDVSATLTAAIGPTSSPRTSTAGSGQPIRCVVTNSYTLASQLGAFSQIVILWPANQERRHKNLYSGQPIRCVDTNSYTLVSQSGVLSQIVILWSANQCDSYPSFCVEGKVKCYRLVLFNFFPVPKPVLTVSVGFWKLCFRWQHSLVLIPFRCNILSF